MWRCEVAEVHAPDRILYIGDVGRKVRVMTELDLATDAYAAGDLACKAVQPVTGTTLSWAVNAIEDAATGVVLVIPSSMTQTGQYQLQVTAAKGGAPTKASPIMDLFVEDKIQ